MIEEENLTKHWIKWLTKIKSIKTNGLINHLNRVFPVRPLANTSLPKKTGIAQSSKDDWYWPVEMSQLDFISRCLISPCKSLLDCNVFNKW